MLTLVVPDKHLGNVLRTTLVDERGRVWSLYPSNVIGMSIVSAGLRDFGGIFSPTDVPSLLERQDKAGTNVSAYGRSYPFVFGSTTLIPPGQTMTVVMNFAQHIQDANSGSPKSFQIVTEIVVGTVTTGAKKSYSLHNLTFDRLNVI